MQLLIPTSGPQNWLNCTEFFPAAASRPLVLLEKELSSVVSQWQAPQVVQELQSCLLFSASILLLLGIQPCSVEAVKSYMGICLMLIHPIKVVNPELPEKSHLFALFAVFSLHSWKRVK